MKFRKSVQNIQLINERKKYLPFSPNARYKEGFVIPMDVVGRPNQEMWGKISDLAILNDEKKVKIPKFMKVFQAAKTKSSHEKGFQDHSFTECEGISNMSQSPKSAGVGMHFKIADARLVRKKVLSDIRSKSFRQKSLEIKMEMDVIEEQVSMKNIPTSIITKQQIDVPMGRLSLYGTQRAKTKESIEKPKAIEKPTEQNLLLPIPNQQKIDQEKVLSCLLARRKSCGCRGCGGSCPQIRLSNQLTILEECYLRFVREQIRDKSKQNLNPISINSDEIMELSRRESLREVSSPIRVPRIFRLVSRGRGEVKRLTTTRLVQDKESTVFHQKYAYLDYVRKSTQEILKEDLNECLSPDKRPPKPNSKKRRMALIQSRVKFLAMMSSRTNISKALIPSPSKNSIGTGSIEYDSDEEGMTLKKKTSIDMTEVFNAKKKEIKIWPPAVGKGGYIMNTFRHNILKDYKSLSNATEGSNDNKAEQMHPQCSPYFPKPSTTTSFRTKNLKKTPISLKLESVLCSSTLKKSSQSSRESMIINSNLTPANKNSKKIKPFELFARKKSGIQSQPYLQLNCPENLNKTLQAGTKKGKPHFFGKKNSTGRHVKTEPTEIPERHLKFDAKKMHVKLI